MSDGERGAILMSLAATAFVTTLGTSPGGAVWDTLLEAQAWASSNSFSARAQEHLYVAEIDHRLIRFRFSYCLLNIFLRIRSQLEQTFDLQFAGMDAIHQHGLLGWYGLLQLRRGIVNLA